MASSLSRRGWAGGYAPAEREYTNAHPPVWYAAAQEKGRRIARAHPQNGLIERPKTGLSLERPNRCSLWLDPVFQWLSPRKQGILKGVRAQGAGHALHSRIHRAAPLLCRAPSTAPTGETGATSAPTCSRGSADSTRVRAAWWCAGTPRYPGYASR